MTTPSVEERALVFKAIGDPTRVRIIELLRAQREGITGTEIAEHVGVSLALGLRWRRRAPQELPAPPHPAREPEVPDARWLATGEAKAVAARAAAKVWHDATDLGQFGLGLIGVRYRYGGDTPAAQIEFREAVRLKPRYAEAHYNLALALHQEGKEAESLSKQKKAYEISPELRNARTRQ